ncbi:MAG: hypothetical protein MUP60_01105, partial [Candidatus Thorarchaeota archaeon]|nr:hypothetical protein [Candidatus Thorarchaeota archaeon]
MSHSASKSPMSLTLINEVLEGSTIKQLLASVERVKSTTLIVYLLLGLIMGVGFGYIIGNFVPIP